MTPMVEGLLLFLIELGFMAIIGLMFIVPTLLIFFILEKLGVDIDADTKEK